MQVIPTLRGFSGLGGSHLDVRIEGESLKEVALLGLHADGVQYTQSVRVGHTKSIVVGSMNLISGQSDKIKGAHMPLFAVPKNDLCACGCGGYHTWQVLFDVLSWSFNCLSEGFCPDCRHDSKEWSSQDKLHRLPAGTPLPRAALQQIRGDLGMDLPSVQVQILLGD
jgi:hypothetical protein